MSSVRGQIFAAIEAAVTAIPGIAEVELMPSGDPAKFPAVHILDDGDVPVESETGAKRYGLRARLEGYVAGGSGSEAHIAMTDLHAAVVEAVMNDPALEALTETIEDGDRRPQIAELADRRSVAFGVDFDISFSTRRGFPSQPA